MYNRIYVNNGMGRPRIDNPMHRVSFRISPDVHAWIKENGGSEMVRELLDEAIRSTKEEKFGKN